MLVDGRELTSLNGCAWRAIGVVFRHFNLLSSCTLHDNVGLPLEIAGLTIVLITQQMQVIKQVADGLNPRRDAIAIEADKSPYVNLLAVREQDKDKPWVAKLIKACQSEEIRTFIQTEFKGSVLAGF